MDRQNPVCARIALECSDGSYELTYNGAVRLVSESLADVPATYAEDARVNGWNALVKRTEAARPKALELTVAQVKGAVECECKLMILERVVAYARA
jgi:hypothetical protein